MQDITDFSHMMSFVNFMPVGALIGGGVSFGLSFTTFPILAVHGIIAASITIVFGIYLYRRDEDFRTTYKDLVAQFVIFPIICVVSMVITGMLSIFINPLLSGVMATMLGRFISPSLSVVAATSLIPAITGFLSPLCTALFVKTSSHLWKSEGYKFIASVCASASLGYVMIQYTSLSPLILGIIACTPFPFISLVVYMRSNKSTPSNNSNIPEGLDLFASTMKVCGYAAVAASVTTIISPVLADTMLVLSWQTPLAYAAIAATTLAVDTLLYNVVTVPVVQAIHSVCDNTGDVCDSWEHIPN